MSESHWLLTIASMWRFWLLLLVLGLLAIRKLAWDRARYESPDDPDSVPVDRKTAEASLDADTDRSTDSTRERLHQLKVMKRTLKLLTGKNRLER